MSESDERKKAARGNGFVSGCQEGLAVRYPRPGAALTGRSRTSPGIANKHMTAHPNWFPVSSLQSPV